MIKKLLVLLGLSLTMAVSCEGLIGTDEIWDKLNDHENRISSLEATCNRLNENITSIQAILEAVQKGLYVTDVKAVVEGGVEVGYMLTFSDGSSVTVYHGKNGQDGKDGVDGTPGSGSYVPKIGVAMDADGRYYWTLDGQWLLDDKGNKIPTTGKDGKDGITPQLKIVDGYWYVSYDNGMSWSQLGQATGDTGADGPQGPEGPQGNPEENGDSFFKSVTEGEKYVSLVLADGTEILIPKYQDVAVNVELSKVTGFTAVFKGTVNKTSPDLKVTVYYATYGDLTVYRHVGSKSLTEFPDKDFELKVNGLAAHTQYFYFTEVLYNGTKTFSEVGSFVTDDEDSYVDWGEGENIGGDI